MPNAENNALALLGCLGWIALIALVGLLATGALVGIARNPPILITLFWGVVNIGVVVFLVAILRPPKKP